MKLKFNVAMNEIGGKFVAVPVGNVETNFNGFLKLNESGAFIVEQLNNEISYDELVAKCTEKYDCPSEEAKQSIDYIIGKLKESGLLDA